MTSSRRRRNGSAARHLLPCFAQAAIQRSNARYIARGPRAAAARGLGAARGHRPGRLLGRLGGQLQGVSSHGVRVLSLVSGLGFDQRA